MEAWRSRDFDTIYDFTVAEDLPVPEQFRAEIDAAPSLSDYTLTAGMVNGERAALNVDASLLTDGASTALEAWPLTLEAEHKQNTGLGRGAKRGRPQRRVRSAEDEDSPERSTAVRSLRRKAGQAAKKGAEHRGRGQP